MVSTDIRVLPMLMGVGLFIVFVGLFYTTYTPTGKAYENQMAILEARAKYGPNAAFNNIIGSSCTVPINDVGAYSDAYANGTLQSRFPGVFEEVPSGIPVAYYQGVNFIWDKTNTYFYVEASWNENYNGADDIYLLITTWGYSQVQHDNEWVSAHWNNITLPPDPTYDWTPVQIGRDWFLSRNIGIYLTMIPVTIVGATVPGAQIPAAVYDGIILYNGAYEYGVGGTNLLQGVWPYDVQLSISSKTTAANYGTTDNLIRGYVTIKWDTYANDTGSVLGKTISDITSTIKGVVVGAFGAVFGDYGKQFVNTLSSVLTMDFPGMPTTIRAIIAVPLNLAIIFIIIGVIAMFIPKVF